ncbi:MAG: class I SAM-dependent methyltransferase [Candidatus Omnitrophica bacterium]|nr:class I SAM-dependent methyltransferase [Candidatus Omnitrophota bacterium]
MEPAEYRIMSQVEDTHWWFLGLRHLTLQSICRYAIGTKSSILDAGCGTGGLLRFISAQSRSHRLVGIDISRIALDLLRSAGKPSVACASVEKLPFRSQSFDVVTSLDVLYTRGIDAHWAAREFFHVLKPGGLLIVNLPAFEFIRSTHDKAIRTGHRYQKREVVTLLEGAGFSVTIATYWNTFLFPIICLIRLLRSRDTCRQHSSDVKATPSALNYLLLQILRLENRLVASLPLPFGTSVFCIAQKQ